VELSVFYGSKRSINALQSYQRDSGADPAMADDVESGAVAADSGAAPATAASNAAADPSQQLDQDGAVIEPGFMFGFSGSTPGCVSHLEGSNLLLLAGQQLAVLEQDEQHASFIPLHARFKAVRRVASSPNRKYAAALEELWPLDGGDEQQQVLLVLAGVMR